MSKLAIAVVVLSACGGDADHPDAMACDRIDLSGASHDLALPTGYVAAAFAQFADDPACGAAGTPSYAAVDVTGDHVLDLVVTHLCGDATVGSSRWIVHPGSAQGFGDAQSWTLPAGYPGGAFTRLADTIACGASGTPSYATLDVTGDGRPDLVVTHVCGDADTGNTRWLVYPGGASGFGAAQTWALPSGYAAGAFSTIAASTACGSAGTPTYTLADATGDGKPDLIVTHLCGDATVGSARWIVHPAGSNAFGAAQTWSLPSGYAAGAFDEPAAAPACGADGTPTYAALDLDHDRRIDLVVTALCGHPEVGTSQWTVHHGMDGGFATAATFALPTGYPTASFRSVAASPACGPSGTPTYALADAGGDGIADLVVTSVCGEPATRWRVHRGSVAGFAAMADDVALPSGYAAGAFSTIAGSTPCGAAETPTYVFTDADGDGRPDLVVTSVCGHADVGTSVWRLHASACVP